MVINTGLAWIHIHVITSQKGKKKKESQLTRDLHFIPSITTTIFLPRCLPVTYSLLYTLWSFESYSLFSTLYSFLSSLLPLVCLSSASLLFPFAHLVHRAIRSFSPTTVLDCDYFVLWLNYRPLICPS